MGVSGRSPTAELWVTGKHGYRAASMVRNERESGNRSRIDGDELPDSARFSADRSQDAWPLMPRPPRRLCALCGQLGLQAMQKTANTLPRSCIGHQGRRRRAEGGRPEINPVLAPVQSSPPPSLFPQSPPLSSLALTSSKLKHTAAVVV